MNIILISLFVCIYICMCYIYFIITFHEICTVSIVSAYSSQGFMAIANISIALTLYICPCKTVQAECQIPLLEQRGVFSKCFWRVMNYELSIQKLPLKLQGVTQLLAHFRLLEHPHLNLGQQFAELPD